ncbi:T9SS type A sorting domain-containing protein [Chitinophaga nivalis]|uniref:T9SS type A sorting domain-containing protein n=1 Tax=Chitinophaga nivalis TaxID=2991709 RepID=A0ABT3IJB1_9BACT|nr:T9SS type A sorting domain-containing protein [Chitinophaga nivalis]MCW3466258.1 T9SS type A sorting domain-containing protein [Chitinophaga nivalis]MCW3484051.1 T9SS type A sorting domain-containing protein [Chitinophaga nivalis]
MKNLSGALQHRSLSFLLACSIFFSNHLITQAQVKTYANSETHQTTFPCVLCSVQNPSNSVGNNEQDYATLHITAGLGGSVSQTLSFPAAVDSSFIVLGIGSNSSVLSLNLLGGATAETFLGNISNNDTKVIDSVGLHLLADSSKATVILFKSKPFDRVKITLKTSLIGLLENLRLYYAYHTKSISSCGYMPPSPLAWYPFNGNFNDSTPHRYDGRSTDQFFTAGVCKQAFGPMGSMDRYRFPVLSNAVTVSFWIKDSKAGANLESKLYIGPLLFFFFHNSSTSQPYCRLLAAIDQSVAFFREFDIDTTFKQITVTYANSNRTLSLYLNAQLVRSSYVPPLDIAEGIFIIPGFNIIDELIIYDRALDKEEVNALYYSYTQSIASPLLRQQTVDNAPISKYAANISTAQSLDFYPNPTTGIIQISSKADLNGGILTISNLAGKVLYQTITTTNNIQLPAFLPTGTYLIRLQTKDKKMHTGKIVLNR